METNTINPIAKDLNNAVDGHFIGEKLADLIDAQVFRLITNKTFAQEAAYIKTTCERNNLDTVVDFGCWTGILASEVFNTGIKLEKYYCVDAVPYYIAQAKIILKNKPVTYETVTLLPPSYKSAPPQSMLVHPYDTLNSSSLYSGYFLKEDVKKANVTVPLADSKPLTNYISERNELFRPNCYVKIDLDGIDLELVGAIIRQGLNPGAIHFEVWNSFKGGYTRAANALANMGYKVPAPNLHIHQSFSVGISRNFWWAVGYDDINTNPRMTYYDQDHGETPVSF